MAIQNKLTDLNNHLFAMLERLSDDEIMNEKDSLEREVIRSKAITEVGKVVISNAQLVLDATKHADEYGYNKIAREKRGMPRILGVENGEK